MEDSLAYPLTLIELAAFLPLLRKEAEENRWQNVRPENFRLHRDERSSLISLEYTDNYNYLIMFRIGMENGCFGAERSDLFIDMWYEFRSISSSETLKAYYDKENEEFCQYANMLVDVPMSWNALHFNSINSVYISCYKEYALQKFCLLLDLLIPLLKRYCTTEGVFDETMLKHIHGLEELMETDFEIMENDEPTVLFGKGHFI